MAKVKRRVGCCGGVRVGRSIVRNASKITEKQMIEKADALYKDPFIVLPTCKDNTCEKKFKKIRKQIEKIEDIKDDTKKLEKSANKKSLPSAIAGTLLIHHAQKAPFLAAAPLTNGTVLFAQRGNAPREQLIAVQHHDDPFLRLLAVRDIILKYDLYVYSWDTSYICMSNANPPKEFIQYVIQKQTLTLTDSFAVCPHLSKETIQQKHITQQPYLLIHWKSANTSIGICQSCASEKTNFLYETTKYLIEPDIQSDFSIEVIGRILQETSTNEETLYTEEYFSGRISDKKLIEKNMDNRLNSLKESADISYVLNNKSYDTTDEFIDALHPNEYERKALSILLNKHNKSLVVSDVTPNTVIEMLWDEHGLQLLQQIVDDTQIADDLFALPDAPSQIIKTAYDIQKRKNILKKLPQYQNLPPLAKFPDNLARLYRVEGEERVLIESKKYPEGPKGKAMSYGFLLAIHKEKDFKWKFEKEEIESGEFLKPYIDTLLTCSPDEYHQALQEVLTYSGTSIDLSTYKK